MECRTIPALGIWVHWSGAYGPLLQGLMHQPVYYMTHPRWQGRQAMSQRCPEQQACL